jgi:molybdate transport system substrate-binding protein
MPFAKDPRAQGRAVAFAINPTVLIVPAGNPAHVTGLDAFAAGGPLNAHCKDHSLCGTFATAWLAKARVAPHWTLQLPTGSAVTLAVGQGRAQVGLVTGLDLTPGDTTVTTVAVGAPPPPKVVYHMLSMSPNPTAAQFERWLATSPDARSIEASYGLLPGNGKTAT